MHSGHGLKERFVPSWSLRSLEQCFVIVYLHDTSSQVVTPQAVCTELGRPLPSQDWRPIFVSYRQLLNVDSLVAWKRLCLWQEGMPSFCMAKRKSWMDIQPGCAEVQISIYQRFVSSKSTPNRRCFPACLHAFQLSRMSWYLLGHTMGSCTITLKWNYSLITGRFLLKWIQHHAISLIFDILTGFYFETTHQNVLILNGSHQGVVY